MSDKRQHAHEIIDHIPESQLSTAVGLLEKILDPVGLALVNAPIDAEPETEEERADVAESHEWLKRSGGKGIPHDEVILGKPTC
jgi:hypothetical protein